MRKPTPHEFDLVSELAPKVEALIAHYRAVKDAGAAETVKDCFESMLDLLNIGICESCDAVGEATTAYYCADRRCPDCVAQDYEDANEEARNIANFRLKGWQ